VASSSGDFGGPNAPKQCTAISKRSKERCKGPAVVGSRTQKCRMHGGKSLVGAANPSFKHGRFSAYLPANIQQLYDEALSNPDLLEMSDHIALLEARISEILGILAEEEVVPRWSTLTELFAELEPHLLSGDAERRDSAIGRIHELMDAGKKFDRSWDNVQDSMEQLRKMADTEIKRRKELNLMVPIERVMVLMSAVATAVKRHAKDPAVIQAVYSEIEAMRTGDTSADSRGVQRVSETVSNLPSAVLGPSGGGSKHALARTRRAREAAIEAEVIE